MPDPQVAEILELSVFHGCLHWLGELEHGMWIEITAARLMAFQRTDDGRVFLSYQTFARGLDMLNSTYHMLDLTPKGRDEDGLDFSMGWLRRHDSYAD